MLNSLIVIGLVCLVILGSMGIALKMYRKKVAKERLEYRRQRDLARQIKLQNKIDEFNEFKKSLGYTDEEEYCNEDCMDCREFDHEKYEKCKNARKYYDSRPVLKNIRTTLQDYSIQEVLVLYEKFA